jgi:hypothetical protein
MLPGRASSTSVVAGTLLPAELVMVALSSPAGIRLVFGFLLFGFVVSALSFS